MSRRRAAAALVVAAALVLSAGCVRMPEDGPVVEVRSDGSTSVDQPPFIDPKPPQPDDFPRDIVKGFLDAMTAFPTDLTVARQFLTEDAQASWNPKHETITYAEASSPRGAPPGVSVTLTGGDLLDGRGAWRGRLPPDQRILQFPMVRGEDGEWRISEVPNALVVPETWFEQRYRQVSLYFFDPAAQILVPEPVFVPLGEQLATTLTEALLRGPGPRLSRVSRSFIPPGLVLGLSVTVADGVADISLKGEAAQQTPQATALMLAQFSWTLRQEPTISALRVSIDGQPILPPGTVDEVDVSQGGGYDPTYFQASSSLFGLRDGVLVSGPADALERVDGPLGSTAYGLSEVAVNLDGTVAAGVSGRGRSVLRAGVAGPDDRVREILSGATELLRPAWDVDDRLWLVDRAADGARVWYLRGDKPVPLNVGGVSGRNVRDFLVSRDGSRFVAVVRRPGAGDVLMVSRIEHDTRGRVLRATRAHRIAWEGEGTLLIRDIGWAGATTIAVLSALTDDLSSVRTISVDGSPPGLDSLATTLRGRVRALASSPVSGASLYAVSTSNLLDLSSPTRGDVALDPGVSSVGYAG